MNTFTQAVWFQRNAAFESTSLHLYGKWKDIPTIKCLKYMEDYP